MTLVYPTILKYPISLRVLTTERCAAQVDAVILCVIVPSIWFGSGMLVNNTTAPPPALAVDDGQNASQSKKER